MRLISLRVFKTFAIIFLGLFGTVAGSIGAVFLTPAGRGLAGRTLSEQLDKIVAGDIEVGAVGGPLWSGLDVEHVVIRDSAGERVLEARGIHAQYHPLDLIAGRIVLSDVTLDGVRVNLERSRNGKWNLETLFKSKGADSIPKPPPLVRFERLTITDGRFRVLQPWDPPDSMRAPRDAERALAAARSKPGRVIEMGPEGYRSIITFDRFGGRFPRLQLSSPAREPITARIDSLAVRASEPAVDLRNARGTASLAGDTLRLDLQDVTLPASVVSGKGTIRLTSTGPRFDVAVIAPRVALRDLEGLVPGIPDLTGSARATLRTRPDGRLAIDIRDLAGGGRRGRASGNLVVVTGGPQGVSFEQLDVVVAELDPQVFAGWLPSIPLHGRLDGHVIADGPLDALMVDLDIVYRDDRVPGRPANRLSALGRLRIGGPDGLVFDTLTVRESDLDLATVTVLLPTNPLVGRAAVDGELTGPWLAFTWRGNASHRDGERPVSAIRGTATIDARLPSTHFDVDVGLMPLALAGIEGTWPDLPINDNLRGRVKLTGTAESFLLDADLDGGVGHIAGGGRLGMSGAELVSDSLSFRFDSLDLTAVPAMPVRTQLLGTFAARGRRDSLGVFTGSLELVLGAGWVREVPIDSVALRLSADSERVTVDTGFAHWPSGSIRTGGQLARHAPGRSSLGFAAEIEDLGVFDSLVARTMGVEPDTLPETKPLAGRATLFALITGALDSIALAGRLDLRDLEWQYLHLNAATGELDWGGGARSLFSTQVTVDSATWQGWTLNETFARAEGRRDDLHWTVAGRVGPTDTIDASGRWSVRGDSLTFGLDSLSAAMSAHTWRTSRPATFTGVGKRWSVDTLSLFAADGSGELRLAGTLPSDQPGNATLTALGVDLRDLFGLLEQDTIGVQGRLGADLAISGVAKAPLLRGTFSLAEGGYRDFRAPYLQGAVDYAGKRLQATAILWRTGRQALYIEADSLPVDLAFTGVKDRFLPGPLSVRATADSADLGMLEAFTKNLRRVRGSLDADVTVKGSWDSTRLDGRVRLVDAAATLPGIGVRWEKLNAAIRLVRDSVVIDTLTMKGGEGTLRVNGSVQFPRNAQPQLDMRIVMDRFRAMDVRNYLTLVASAPARSRLAVKGPLYGATLTGAMNADEGALYFADLITKQIVDLNDPTTADLIDTALVREGRLGPSLQNRFLDSLRINEFEIVVGDGYWLRSADANVKLGGRARVGKIGRTYRLDGTLTAERGTYVLRMGVIARDFDVQRGTVRFLGTPDLNAELDLEATHHVRPTDGSSAMDLQARITGTLLVPKLTLSNPDNPQMTETEMVSYLMFGRGTSNLASANTAEGAQQRSELANSVSNYVLPMLSSEIERTLISDLGVPVDYIQIRAGGFGTNSISSSQTGLATITAGWQVGRKTFVALNAGICTNVSELSYRNFGASLEQRLHKDWRAMLSVEPVITCSSAPGGTTLATSSIYQLGLDLLWDREY